MPGGPLSGIDQTGHNISPRLRKQLVLELKVWIVLTEFLTLLPSSLLLRKACPLNEDEPDATTELCLQHLCRLWKNVTIGGWRKRRRSRRWLATKRLEQPHMEDVVDASVGLVRGSSDCVERWRRRSHTQSPTANSASR